ncbi:MAG: hypothetical protein LBE91_03355 [Tannerella sp.]|nr:hypothetical protein [Tannerella sp.]
MNYIQSYCNITPERVVQDGKLYYEYARNEFIMHDFLSSLYVHSGVEYRKFYKMDLLSKLGFLSSELLLPASERETPKEDMGIILFNSSSSLNADAIFQKTIQDGADFFPSPADFVYTLPNIVTGEIAIRNKIYGETCFYVLPDFQADTIYQTIDATMTFSGMNSLLAGWLEVDMEAKTLCSMMLLCVKNEEAGNFQLNAKNINNLYINHKI